MSWDGLTDLVWDAERLRIATDAAGVALWSWNIDTDEIALDQHAHDLWGVPRSDERLTFKHLSTHIHPADLDRVRNAFVGTRLVPGPYEIDFRILHGREIRWISARGQGKDQGIVGRVLFGIFLNVTDRKQAQEAREMLALEMSQRVRNLFTVASSLTTIAVRSAATATEMAHDLTQRLSALRQTQDLVRSTPGPGEGKAVLLSDLLITLLMPYDDPLLAGARVQASVPEVLVGENSAATLALVVHELASNSIRYGALSVASGTLRLSGTVRGSEMIIVWKEQGGPPVSALTSPTGFGSKLVMQSITGSLGGSVHFDWRLEGAVVTLRINRSRLAT